MDSQNAKQNGKYLLFLSDNRTFAIEFQNINSIAIAKNILPIPEFPYYFAGTCIVEEKIVPVIDARRRFGFDEIPITDRSCVITCYANNGNDVVLIGILVDTISVMAEIDLKKIQPFEAFSNEAYTRYLTGVFVENDLPCYIVSPDLMINDTDRDNVLST